MLPATAMRRQGLEFTVTLTCLNQAVVGARMALHTESVIRFHRIVGPTHGVCDSFPPNCALCCYLQTA